MSVTIGSGSTRPARPGARQPLVLPAPQTKRRARCGDCPLSLRGVNCMQFPPIPFHPVLRLSISCHIAPSGLNRRRCVAPRLCRWLALRFTCTAECDILEVNRWRWISSCAGCCHTLAGGGLVALHTPATVFCSSGNLLPLEIRYPGGFFCFSLCLELRLMANSFLF